jgi:hypothetical protein
MDSVPGLLMDAFVCPERIVGDKCPDFAPRHQRRVV